MENKALHKLGIDIGSTTVKIAVLDAQDNLLFSDYERHYANIQETLASIIEKAYDEFQDSYQKEKEFDLLVKNLPEKMWVE